MRHVWALALGLVACSAPNGTNGGDESVGVSRTLPAAGGVPALTPESFDVIAVADRYQWDAIRALADADLGPIITSQNRPADLPASRWARPNRPRA